MSTNQVDQYYQKISDALSVLVNSARVDSKNNLQNKNVLMEGFYREFLNILFDWRLVNANSEQQNAKGIDLIDRENRVVVQVSAKCYHQKIKDSLRGFQPTDGEGWRFLFVSVKEEGPKPTKDFIPSTHVSFDWKKDILDTARLLNLVMHAVQEKQFALSQFVSLEKVKLWEHLNGLLRRTRDNHPSFVLMKPDDIDERLYPNIKEDSAPLPAYGKVSDGGAACRVWDIIRDSWQKPENHSIVIEGAGGIGKTVALFSIADEGDRYCPAPAVYVPMHRLAQYEDLSDFCRRLSDTYGQRINELAERPWDNGPQLLVLLDGFNEVPTAKQQHVLGMLKGWHLTHPGAQYIAVSRPVDGVNLGKDLAGNPIAIELEPMKEAVARAYLSERGVALPDDGADIWKTLVLPLFLTLYVKTIGLMGKTVVGYPLAPKEPENGGALIWNYLQRELLRDENGERVLHCAITCEYVLPYVAYQMVKESRFSLNYERLVALASDAIQSLDFRVLPNHLKVIIDLYKKEARKTHPRMVMVSVSDIDGLENALLQAAIWNTGVLVPDPHKEDSYTFMHQHFRDALAGLYLVNRAEMMRDGDELPEVWRRAANYEVMGYAAELMEELEAQRLWEANRVTQPTDKSATYAMMELQMRRWNRKHLGLNFSGMDLRGMSLVRFMREKHMGERDMKLFQRPELSVRTRLNEETFRSPGHTDSVSCVAMMEDGRCVSGSFDNTLRVWDLISDECLCTLEGHAGWVNCVAVMGIGQCVSGSRDGTLRVWDLNTGECLRTLKGHTDWVRCVAVTADGRCVSGSDDKTLRVWNLDTGECLRTLKGHTGWVNCVAMAGDGQCISGSYDNTLRVWDLNTGECLRTLKGHTDWVRCVAMMGDGRCVSGSKDNALRVWDIRTGKCLRTLKGNTHWVNCVAATEDGQCVSGAGKTLQVWDLNTGECLRTLKGHTDGVNCVAATEDGQCVSGSWDNTLRVWDLNTGECLRTLEGHDSWVRCVAVTEDGRCVSGSNDATLRVWDLNTSKCLRTLEGHIRRVNSVAVTGDGRCVSGSGDYTLRVWDLSTGKCFRTLEGHGGWVNSVAATGDGQCISGSRDRTLRVWDLNTGRCLRTLGGHVNGVNSVASTGDGWCVSGSWDDTLRVWGLNTGECLRTLKGHAGSVSCVAVTGDGRCISGSDDHTLRVWNLNTGECCRTLVGHADWVRCVTVTGDGRCVSGSSDSTLRVWNLNTGECLRTLKEHTGSVYCVAVTKDGLCVSGSDDGTLRVWNIDTGECLDVLRSTEVDVSGMDFSEAVLATPELARTLWQNRAKVCENGVRW